MSYLHLKGTGYQSLADLSTSNTQEFFNKATSIVSDTVERHLFLFNSFPEELLGITNNIYEDVEIEPLELQKLLQSIATVQERIAIKTKALKEPDGPMPIKAKLNGKSKTTKTSINSKTKVIMKNSKQTLVNGTDKAVSAVFGSAHFVFQTLADVTAVGEASIRCKLIDKSKDEIYMERVQKTAERQKAVIDSAVNVRLAMSTGIKKFGKLAETKSSATFTKVTPDMSSHVSHTV